MRCNILLVLLVVIFVVYSRTSEASPAQPATKPSSDNTVQDRNTRSAEKSSESQEDSSEEHHPHKKFFRNDYTYLHSKNSFYKIHTAHRTWDDAASRCEMEGATLFYPKDGTEAQEVRYFWNETQNTIDSVFVGIKAFYARQAFLTIDRRPLRDVYSKWAPGRPNMYYKDADCVILNSNGLLHDVQCQTRRPFICKKRAKDLRWNRECNMPDTDYIYTERTGQCYKFHTDPKNWTEAADTCYAEQSYLAIIDDDDEAKFLSKFALANHGQDNHEVPFPNVIFLGFRLEVGKIWMTIKGMIIDKKSHRWADGEPSGGDDEQCGSMFANNGRLNDQACDPRLFYICEHDHKRRHEDISNSSEETDDRARRT